MSEDTSANNNCSSNSSLSQKIKALWKHTYVKIISVTGVLVVLMSAFVTFCDFFGKFGLDWCPIPPNPVVEQARNLFSNNRSANLEVKIQPTSPIVGEEMYLHFTNHSDKNGYWLAFNINSNGALEPYIPNTLEPDEMRMYFQIPAGQELIIPQPGVPEDPFFGLSPRQPTGTGKELLVVILVDKLTPELVNELLFAPQKEASAVLQALYDKLTKRKSSSLLWSSVVIDYETK